MDFEVRFELDFIEETSAATFPARSLLLLDLIVEFTVCDFLDSLLLRGGDEVGFFDFVISCVASDRLTSILLRACGKSVWSLMSDFVVLSIVPIRVGSFPLRGSGKVT